ncbi:MAG: hypothetical protein QCH34_01480, partial [Methanocalculus sp.]|nr:hypothetical protein [Methanocalculus sp.]
SIGLFPFLILTIIGEDLFSIFLGSDWANAGLYAKILAPWLFFVFISSPLSSVFNVLEKQGVSFAFNVLLLVSRVVALCIGGMYGNPVTALVLFSGSGVVFWGWMNMYILSLAGVSVKESFLDILRYMLIGCITVIPLMIGMFFYPDSVMLIILAVAVTLAYYLIILFDDIMLREEFFRIIREIHD